MVKTKIRLIIFFATKDGERLYSQHTIPYYTILYYTVLYYTILGADYSSDHELLIAKFKLKLKKVGKTTGPFRYDLNQTPYSHTVEVTNRFKGLDMIDRVPEELWTEVCNTVQEAVTKSSPRNKCKAK